MQLVKGPNRVLCYYLMVFWQLVLIKVWCKMHFALNSLLQTLNAQQTLNVHLVSKRWVRAESTGCVCVLFLGCFKPRTRRRQTSLRFTHCEVVREAGTWVRSVWDLTCSWAGASLRPLQVRHWAAACLCSDALLPPAGHLLSCLLK